MTRAGRRAFTLPIQKKKRGPDLKEFSGVVTRLNKHSRINAQKTQPVANDPVGIFTLTACVIDSRCVLVRTHVISSLHAAVNDGEGVSGPSLKAAPQDLDVFSLVIMQTQQHMPYRIDNRARPYAVCEIV